MQTVQIRNMYNEDFGTVLNEFQRWFSDLAERITRARGWTVLNPLLQPVGPPDVKDNGILPPTQDQNADLATMPINLRNRPGTWQLGACYGAVGSFGIVSIWRLVDASGRTLDVGHTYLGDEVNRLMMKFTEDILEERLLPGRQCGQQRASIAVRFKTSGSSRDHSAFAWATPRNPHTIW